jgi:hypothetical protein
MDYPLEPVWWVTLDGRQVLVHDKNCPHSVQQMCFIAVDGTYVGHDMDDPFPIAMLVGIDEKFLTIMANGVDPDIKEGTRKIYCGSTSLTSVTPMPYFEDVIRRARSNALLRE